MDYSVFSVVMINTCTQLIYIDQSLHGSCFGETGKFGSMGQVSGKALLASWQPGKKQGPVSETEQVSSSGLSSFPFIDAIVNVMTITMVMVSLCEFGG